MRHHIVGAGIAGLSLATLLARSGKAVAVFERQSRADLQAHTGFGLQLSANACAALATLNALEDLHSKAHRQTFLRVLDATKTTATSTTTAPKNAPSIAPNEATEWTELARRSFSSGADAFTGMHLGVARHALHTALLQQALQAGVELHFAAPVNVATLHDWSRDPRLLVFGCDGHNSVVRQALSGIISKPSAAESPATPTKLALRTLLPIKDWPVDIPLKPWRTGVSLLLWPGGNGVVYPIDANATVFNVVVILAARQNANPNYQTDAGATNAALLNNLGLLGRLLQAPKNQPPTLWSLPNIASAWPALRLRSARGAGIANTRMALLGDAALPLLPHLAQGAGLALEDACTLAHCLDKNTKASAALRDYSRIRWWRRTRVALHSQFNGWGFQLGGWRKDLRNLWIKTAGERTLKLDWLNDWRPPNTSIDAPLAKPTKILHN